MTGGERRYVCDEKKALACENRRNVDQRRDNGLAVCLTGSARITALFSAIDDRMCAGRRARLVANTHSVGDYLGHGVCASRCCTEILGSG